MPQYFRARAKHSTYVDFLDGDSQSGSGLIPKYVFTFKTSDLEFGAEKSKIAIEHDINPQEPLKGDLKDLRFLSGGGPEYCS